MPKSFEDLLEGNINWVNNTLQEDPDFFNRLAEEQHPNFLWIGCADSRVPETQITDALPGSVFVQRNIANMVVHTDTNLLSVVNYAVKVLKVKHIIICGHYGCGGVEAALGNKKLGFLDSWLLHIKDVYRQYGPELDAIEDESARFDRLVELNVQEQVSNMAKVSFIQEEWAQGEFPQIHGWVYSLHNGLLKDLKISINSPDGLEPVFRYKKD